MDETRQSVQQQLSHTQKLTQDAFIAQKRDQYESAFSKVGEVFKPLIGSGPTDDLSPSSPAVRLRLAIVHEAEVSRRVASEMGRRVPTIEQAVSTLLTAKFPNVIIQAEREKIRKESTTRQAQMTNPPTSRRGSAEPTGDEQALAEFRDIWNRNS